MIIACPHCQTKYQVTYEAIGSAGRKVQCAHCQKAWQQAPLGEGHTGAAGNAAVEAFAEDALDEALATEERTVAAELAKRVADEETRQKSSDAAKIDPALIRRRQKAFSRRQDAINAGQPLAKLRRGVRVGLVLLLCGTVAGAYFARVPIVQRYPALAGVYEAVGLGVNVVGLEFSDVSTQRTLRDGKDLLVVSAQIVGLAAEPTSVPAVVVTLLGSEGEEIYAWSITPSIPDLMAGERATFDTQLVMPPGDAERVRLSFVEGRPGPATGIAPSEPAAPAHAEAATAQSAHGTAAAHSQPDAPADHAAPPHATPSEHH